MVVPGRQTLLRCSLTPESCPGPVDRWAPQGLPYWACHQIMAPYCLLAEVVVNSGWTNRAVTGTLGPLAASKASLERCQECILYDYFGLSTHLLPCVASELPSQGPHQAEIFFIRQ